MLSVDERNPTSREIIMKRVEGYMTRAEQLREMIESKSNPKPVAAPGGGGGGGEDDEDTESKKMRGALACTLVVFYNGSW